MGCASSSPLVNSGKTFVETAKETAEDAAEKTEKAIHDVTETTKDGINTGIEHVKETVETITTKAEDAVDTVVTKISDTFHTTKDAAEEHAAHFVDDGIRGTADGMGEAVSDAETVVATELEAVKDEVYASSSAAEDKFAAMKGEAVAAFEKVDEKGAEAIGDIKETLQIMDLDEDFDVLDEMERREGEVVPTPAASPPMGETPEQRGGKEEEPPPTFWEAAADAIVLKRLNRSIRNIIGTETNLDAASEKDAEFGDAATLDGETANRFVNIPKILKNGSEVLSLNSYKSNEMTVED